MMEVLPKNSKIIFSGIVGSRAYNLHTEKSDMDIKGVYMQTNEDMLSNRYIPQANLGPDETYYELRRFLELVSTGNPNVLELLYLPERCVVTYTSEWMKLLEHKGEFLSKRCYNTFSGYAKTQLRKATGLNKKFNWEKKRIQRKDIADFMKIVDREDGNTYKIKEWLSKEGYTEKQVGLTSMDGFRDCYRLYTDDIRWAVENHRFDGLELGQIRNYKGIGLKSNQPKLSEVEEYRINDWKGVVYWNRESYSTHCKEYSEYQKWLKNRNEERVATNKSHGQDMDSKNILHLVRLIMTAQEIPTENRINVDRTKDREYLLSIRRGEVDLKQIVEEWGQKAEDLKELYVNSELKDEVDMEFIRNLELKLRKL